MQTKKTELIEAIVEGLYYKPSVWYHRYLGITEEQWNRIKDLKSWLKRQNLAKLDKIIGRLRNG